MPNHVLLRDGHREKKEQPKLKILGDYCWKKCNIFQQKKKTHLDSGKNMRSPIPDHNTFYQPYTSKYKIEKNNCLKKKEKYILSI